MNTDQIAAADALYESRNLVTRACFRLCMADLIEKAKEPLEREIADKIRRLEDITKQAIELKSRAAHASEPWTPKFSGGDAWRIEGSPCSYGYSKQQAEEICNAHNAAVADARDCTCMADAYCKVHGNVPKPAHASEPIDWTAHDKAQRDYAASEDARCRARASEQKEK